MSRQLLVQLGRAPLRLGVVARLPTISATARALSNRPALVPTESDKDVQGPVGEGTDQQSLRQPERSSRSNWHKQRPQVQPPRTQVEQQQQQQHQQKPQQPRPGPVDGGTQGSTEKVVHRPHSGAAAAADGRGQRNMAQVGEVEVGLISEAPQRSKSVAGSVGPRLQAAAAEKEGMRYQQKPQQPRQVSTDVRTQGSTNKAVHTPQGGAAQAAESYVRTERAHGGKVGAEVQSESVKGLEKGGSGSADVRLEGQPSPRPQGETPRVGLSGMIKVPLSQKQPYINGAMGVARTVKPSVATTATPSAAPLLEVSGGQGAKKVAGRESQQQQRQQQQRQQQPQAKQQQQRRHQVQPQQQQHKQQPEPEAEQRSQQPRSPPPEQQPHQQPHQQQPHQPQQQQQRRQDRQAQRQPAQQGASQARQPPQQQQQLEARMDHMQEQQQQLHQPPPQSARQVRQPPQQPQQQQPEHGQDRQAHQQVQERQAQASPHTPQQTPSRPPPPQQQPPKQQQQQHLEQWEDPRAHQQVQERQAQEKPHASQQTPSPPEPQQAQSQQPTSQTPSQQLQPQGVAAPLSSPIPRLSLRSMLEELKAKEAAKVEKEREEAERRRKEQEQLELQRREEERRRAREEQQRLKYQHAKRQQQLEQERLKLEQQQQEKELLKQQQQPVQPQQQQALQRPQQGKEPLKQQQQPLESQQQQQQPRQQQAPQQQQKPEQQQQGKDSHKQQQQQPVRPQQQQQQQQQSLPGQQQGPQQQQKLEQQQQGKESIKQEQKPLQPQQPQQPQHQQQPLPRQEQAPQQPHQAPQQPPQSLQQQRKGGVAQSVEGAESRGVTSQLMDKYSDIKGLVARGKERMQQQQQQQQQEHLVRLMQNPLPPPPLPTKQQTPSSPAAKPNLANIFSLFEDSGIKIKPDPSEPSDIMQRFGKPQAATPEQQRQSPKPNLANIFGLFDDSGIKIKPDPSEPSDIMQRFGKPQAATPEQQRQPPPPPRPFKRHDRPPLPPPPTLSQQQHQGNVRRFEQQQQQPQQQRRQEMDRYGSQEMDGYGPPRPHHHQQQPRQQPQQQQPSVNTYGSRPQQSGVDRFNDQQQQRPQDWGREPQQSRVDRINDQRQQRPQDWGRERPQDWVREHTQRPRPPAPLSSLADGMSGASAPAERMEDRWGTRRTDAVRQPMIEQQPRERRSPDRPDRRQQQHRQPDLSADGYGPPPPQREQRQQQQQQRMGDYDRRPQRRQPQRRHQQEKIKLDAKRAKHLRKLRKVPLVLPPEPLTVRDLARKLSLKLTELTARLEKLGVGEMIDAETLVELDTAEIVAMELGRAVQRAESSQDLEEGLERDFNPDWPLRPPVVCVMGHVDHGKTTLLDALRKTQVAAGEAGGITQRLGAFFLEGLDPTDDQDAEKKDGSKKKKGKGKKKGAVPTVGGPLGVTFLDTPGHAAFTSMREQGATATDIVLLVVSAADGIQTQTKEVVQLVLKEGMSMVVAVTKVDKVGGEVDEAVKKIEEQLSSHGVLTESFGGDVQVVPVSAVTGAGLTDLRERLALQAEIMELRADPEGKGEGVVLDCYVDKGLGTVMSVLVKWGSLKPGQVVVAGDQYGRIKKIVDQDGVTLEEAPPSAPVRVLGLRDLPLPGSTLIVVPTEEKAKTIAEARRNTAMRDEADEAEMFEVVDEDMAAQIQEKREKVMEDRGWSNPIMKTHAFLLMQQSDPNMLDAANKTVRVPFLVKADGKGLLDAVTAALAAYDSDIIRAEVVHADVGAVTAGDVELAKASGAASTVLAFGVGFASGEVSDLARREKVSVFKQNVIYSLLDNVKGVLQENMPMERVETSVGKLEVQATFDLKGRRRTKNTVAGCKVVFGSAYSAQQYRYRVKRGSEVVYDESPPASLFHFKSSVHEVTKGMECGLSLENFGDFQPGDVVECYTVAEKRKDLKDVFPYY